MRRIVTPDLLPSPAAVLRALADLAASGELVAHLEATLARMALGFAAGAAAGTLAGALTGAIPLARRLIDPTVQALRSVPRSPGCRCSSSGSASSRAPRSR